MSNLFYFSEPRYEFEDEVEEIDNNTIEVENDIYYNPFEKLEPVDTELPEYDDDIHNPAGIDSNIQTHIENIVYDIHLFKYWNDIVHETLLSLSSNLIIDNVHERLNTISDYLIDKIVLIQSQYDNLTGFICIGIADLRKFINEPNMETFKMLKNALFERIKSYLDSIEVNVELEMNDSQLFELLKNSTVGETPGQRFLHKRAFENLINNWQKLRPVFLDQIMNELISFIEANYGLTGLTLENLLTTYNSLSEDQKVNIRSWVFQYFANYLDGVYGMLDINTALSHVKELVYDIYINMYNLLDLLAYKCAYLEDERNFNNYGLINEMVLNL